jgi:hypothetical protein
VRDYSKEHKTRAETKKRLRAEIDKEKAAAFLAEIKKRGLSFTEWMNQQIDNELMGEK